ncbi:prolipoprotein diacylglyceryl transferase [Rhodococcus sp. Leaf7]|uniref:prolipoprotein diacylglyceryl transferase n=1 Tax=unclassified Rhodococcus (in: high G+C Gram-positive bacteria) TaxID=192944 RepID=UPI0006F38E36|nr:MULTISPECIES: prolipoprotein diacylglyceryl transferase [unclassified Rhodococcus (in: high G+C Gram-positive bacteria)]KQU06204.1 prolipoprotein diacylglyceryl transferase [Rhodococcus sp. Leaf7]KQU41720.1 prolipoprotein diacylglyceryl transferase [Rhodococcus sp. Leaf247]
MTLASSTAVLAYLPSPPQGVWYVGPLALRAYAFFIIVGIVIAIVWGDKRWVARGGDKGTVLDVAVWAVPFGLIGGRLYHVITDAPTYFGEGGNPVDALKIWQGGLGIWGAVFLGGVGAWIACRRRGIPLPAFGDAVAPGILLAQAIGRIGNYFNQELYGRETTLPWGLEIYERVDANGRVDTLGGVSTGVVERVVHPTFLYELLWNIVIVVLIVLIDRRFRLGHGRIFALYVAGYCAGRFVVELMRSDFATLIGGIRVNSFTSGIVFLLALAYVVLAPKGREDPASLSTRTENETADDTVADDTVADDKAGDDAVADEKTVDEKTVDEKAADDKVLSTSEDEGRDRS